MAEKIIIAGIVILAALLIGRVYWRKLNAGCCCGNCGSCGPSNEEKTGDREETGGE